MNVLFHVRDFFPAKIAGSEVYTNHVDQYLQSKGCKTRYLVEPFSPSAKILESTPSEKAFVDYQDTRQQCYEWADVVWSHLHTAGAAAGPCKAHNKPLVFCHHIEGSVGLAGLKPSDVALNVYNAEWMRRLIEPSFPGNNTILVPFTPKPKKVKAGANFTKLPILHVNCNEQKGVIFTRHLARELPDYEFRFVLGGYFPQLVPQDFQTQMQVTLRRVDFPPNCTFMDQTPFMEDVYRECHALVMPSITETWGMVAAEAMAHGLPVIVHPTPGIQECTGDQAGLWIQRDQASEQIKYLRRLREDQEFYNLQSAAGINRAEQLRSLHSDQLKALYEAMKSLVR